MFRDDVSMLKGNHLFQFGGTYQHNLNWHQRTDNGGGINYQPVYALGNGSSGSGLGSGRLSLRYALHRFRSAIVCECARRGGAGCRFHRSQIAYTRSGANLNFESSADPCFRPEHHSVLQRVFQRHLAYEADASP